MPTPRRSVARIGVIRDPAPSLSRADQPDDPKLPSGARLIFICDVLHHVAHREAWLSHLYVEAESAAKLVVVEFKEGELPEGPPKSVKMTREEVASAVTRAGFARVSEDSALLPYQYVLTFRKP